MRPLSAALPWSPLALAALACVACAGGPRVLSTVDERVERTAGDCEGAGPCARFWAEFPRVRETRPPELRPKLNGIIREMLLSSQVGDGAPTTVASLAESFLDAWRETAEDFPDSATLNWTVDKRMRVLWDRQGLLSLELTDESYTGGAHGIETVRLASIDLATARRLRLDDLLQSGARPALLAAAERAFRASRGIPTETPLVQTRFRFHLGSFDVTDNLAVTPAGLRFHFDAYEIASYADGPSDFTVAWTDLGDLVRPEWRPR